MLQPMSRAIPWLFFAVLATGCSDTPGGSSSGADTGADTGGGGGADAGTPSRDAGAPSGPTALRIAPDNPTLRVVDGVPAELELELFATGATGIETRVESGAIWRAEDDRIGAFADERQPRFSAASPSRAGRTAISAFFGGLSAQTTITVERSIVRSEGGAPIDAPMRFGGAPGQDPARAPAIVYPVEQVLIPKNLAPMTVQWDAQADLDVFRVVLKSDLIEATIYTAARQTALDGAEWADLLESASGGSFQISISAVSSADPTSPVHTAAPLTVRVADGQMRGTIYYWALNLGRILRIRPGELDAEDFFTPPPEPGSGSTCVGCHTLSRDGRKMAFEYYGGWRTHGVVDVVTPDPAIVGPGIFAANFSAFSPGGDRLIGAMNGVLTLWDATSGAGLETLATPALATHPAWSPDGRTVAFASQVAGEAFGDVDFRQADLAVIRSFDGIRSAPEVLVPSAGEANSYPSFSPDSRWLAFSRGPYSRSHRAFDPAAPSAISPADLHVIPVDGGGAVLLARASAGGQALLPAFSPFESGGYFWLAFFSRRDYGHITRGTTRRQIWVTAFDPRAPAGSDPSAPAFWLPGQDASTENMSAYWAPDPCHPIGDLCTLDEDCCQPVDGIEPVLCRPSGPGERRCVSRTQACRIEGEPCVDTSECCGGERLQCTATSQGQICQKLDL